MKRLVLASGLVLLGSTGAAFAQANGCPQGTISTTISPGNKAYSLLFDANEVQRTSDPADPTVVVCEVTVPLVGVPKGTIAVYNAVYDGYVYLQNSGSEANVNIDQSNGDDFSEQYDGDYDDSVSYIGMVASNGDSTIRARTTVDLTDADPDDAAGIDSADYAEIGRITLGTDEMAIVTHLGASSELLTGADQPLEGADYVGVFGGVGSAMFGGTGRFNMGEGISILGGLSIIQQGYETSSTSGVVGSVAVRYVQPGVTSFRPFVEGGVTLAGLNTTFIDALPADTSTNMLLGAVHVRGGVEMPIDEINTVTLGVSAQESALGVDGYVLTDGGPFTATMPDQVGQFTKLKASASLRSQITPEIDVEATGAVGALIAHSDVVANVDGLGTVTARAPTSLFVEYGVRGGYNLSDSTRVEGFVQGSSSTDYGTHAQVGAAFKMTF